MYDATVTQCLKCGTKLKHLKGKKRKMYCSVSCKNGLHQMRKRSLRPPGKPGRPKKIVSDVPVGEKTTKKSIVKAITPVKSSPIPKKEVPPVKNQFIDRAESIRKLKSGKK